jgi:hypothetical protein
MEQCQHLRYDGASPKLGQRLSNFSTLQRTAKAIMGNKDMRKEKKKPKQPKDKLKGAVPAKTGGIRPPNSAK